MVLKNHSYNDLTFTLILHLSMKLNSNNFMKYLLTLLFIAMYGISARATAQTTRIVCDDTCKTESAAMTPTPVWHDSKESQIMTIPTMKEGMTAFIITGDESRNKVQTMPGGGFKTIRIELPRNWDTLMQKRGYRPLSEFYIE